MPYIITTKLPEVIAPYTKRARADEPEPPQTRFRRAVATLDEAREHVENAVYDALGPERLPDDRPVEFATYARELPEEGGTIGPLDGTVIEVRRAYWSELHGSRVPDAFVSDNQAAAIIDAYNEAQVPEPQVTRMED